MAPGPAPSGRTKARTVCSWTPPSGSPGSSGQGRRTLECASCWTEEPCVRHATARTAAGTAMMRKKSRRVGPRSFALPVGMNVDSLPLCLKQTRTGWCARHEPARSGTEAAEIEGESDGQAGHRMLCFQEILVGGDGG